MEAGEGGGGCEEEGLVEGLWRGRICVRWEDFGREGGGEKGKEILLFYIPIRLDDRVWNPSIVA